MLPWRAKPGEAIDPYRVWLSEIMLQQTTVKTVGPYFARFLARWPDVAALAASPLDDVLRLWAGLGYYARARNLHACARAVAERGGFPRTQEELTTLPGIGRYTAAAIAAIAFDVKAVPVDGNVERVVTRLFAIEEELPAAKPEIHRFAQTLAPDARAGDFAQALMDLGATICTPVKPACALCPWMEDCAARLRGDPQTLSAQGAQAGREVAARRGVRRGARRRLRAVAQPSAQGIARRHDRGADHGLVARFRRQARNEDAPRLSRAAPKWKRLPGVVTHVFTHFPLELVVYAAEVARNAGAPDGARWVAIDVLPDEALPTVMRKVLAHALER